MLELLLKIDLMEQNVRTLMMATETTGLNVEMNGYQLGDIESKLERMEVTLNQIQLIQLSEP